MDGYELDPDELRQLKGTLNGASDKLGMKDFSQKASLEGFLTVQDVSPYEDTEKTVDKLVRELTQFVDKDYAKVIQAMQDFINRGHTAITDAADKAHRTAKDYDQNDDQGRHRFN